MKRYISLVALILAFVMILAGCDGILNNNGGGSDNTTTTTDSSQGTNVESNTSDQGGNTEHTGNHLDDDNNGNCDICGISVLVYIDLYALNDLHGKFDDTASNPGVDELTTYLKNANETDDHTIFLSSGDMWQGSAESNLTKGLIITDWMNHLDFVSMTLGNHEYDWGEQYIVDNADIAQFPFLAINVYDSDTNKLVEYCQSSVVVEKGGLQIGIIGAIGDCYSSIASDKSEGVYFVTGDKLTKLVKDEAQKLRDQGVDFIVYSIHDGYGQNKSGTGAVSSSALAGYYDISLSNGYVDLVFEGHTHKSYVLKDSWGVYHLQGGGDGKGISHAEIAINSVNGNSIVGTAEFISSNVYSSMNDDPIVDQLLEKYDDDISKADEYLGKNDVKRSSTVIKQTVAQLYYESGVERWGDKYDIVLGGGFLSTRSPYDLAAGDIYYGDLQSLLPFDNVLTLCSIKGSDLKNKFFNTSNDNYYTYYGEYGADVKNNIDNDATYYIIVDSYTALYAPNRLTVIEEYDSDVFARDLLADFIKAYGWTKDKPAEETTTDAETTITEESTSVIEITTTQETTTIEQTTTIEEKTTVVEDTTTVEEITTREEITTEFSTVEETTTVEQTTTVVEITTVEQTTTIVEITTVVETTTIEETTTVEVTTTVEETTTAEETTTPNHASHTDSNNDGKCDGCRESVMIYIDFYAMNDLHGKFDDTDSNPGVDELTTYLKNANKTDDYTIFLSSGDMWQGSAESNLTQGLLITDWMNHLDFVSMTLGNHEYDWGEDAIKANAALAEFPLLAINIYDSSTNGLVDYCQPSVIVEKDGLQIGIIGAIGDCYSSISGDKSEGVYFVTGNELTNLVKNEAQKLRDQGVDFVVYSIHDGYGSNTSSSTNVSNSSISSYYNAALSNGYVDLVFEGHTHKSYVLIDGYGVYHLQNGGDGKGISHVEIYINSVNNNYTVTVAEFVASSKYSSLEDDPIVDELLLKYDDQISKGEEYIGYNDTTRSSDDIKELVAQLYYQAGIERWGSSYDIVLGGGFLSTRSPYDLASGEVYYSDLYTLLPFDNTLMLCSIQGRYLSSKFFNTSNSNYYIYYEGYGASVKANIDSNATYYVIVDSYTSSYADNNLKVIGVYDTTTFARDLVAQFINDGGWTSSGGNGNNGSGNSGSGGNTTIPDNEVTLTEISEIIRLGNDLGNNATSKDYYYVKGTVVEVKSTKYGNMTIKDEQGNQLYVYGTYNIDGVRYDSLTSDQKPVVGDTVILYAPIKKYVDNSNVVTIELFQARISDLAKG